MRQYPIWNKIIGQGKQSSANFGSRDGFIQEICVGTGHKNSHWLASIEVTNDVDGFTLWLHTPAAHHTDASPAAIAQKIAHFPFEDGKPTTTRPRTAHIGPLNRISDDDVVDITADPIEAALAI